MYVHKQTHNQKENRIGFDQHGQRKKQQKQTPIERFKLRPPPKKMCIEWLFCFSGEFSGRSGNCPSSFGV